MIEACVVKLISIRGGAVTVLADQKVMPEILLAESAVYATTCSYVVPDVRPATLCSDQLELFGWHVAHSENFDWSNVQALIVIVRESSKMAYGVVPFDVVKMSLLV